MEPKSGVLIKLYLEITGHIVLACSIFGFFGPWLLSQKSDLFPLLGVGLFIVYPIVLILCGVRMYKKFRQFYSNLTTGENP